MHHILCRIPRGRFDSAGLPPSSSVLLQRRVRGSRRRRKQGNGDRSPSAAPGDGSDGRLHLPRVCSRDLLLRRRHSLLRRLHLQRHGALLLDPMPPASSSVRFLSVPPSYSSDRSWSRVDQYTRKSDA
ncbi:uncharacterized protein LOC122022991 [Zingiber officinale]|uniref:uncharacterized protein LOC122022991 n=1 Tax=Zingiber officinale TaxID=94328 RepID=UPI001C4DD0FD|nr:uncharacterized protein LOC122022991 [Zingiber officinale]